MANNLLNVEIVLQSLADCLGNILPKLHLQLTSCHHLFPAGPAAFWNDAVFIELQLRQLVIYTSK